MLIECYKLKVLFETSYFYNMKKLSLIFILFFGLFAFTNKKNSKGKHPEIKFKYETLERKNIKYNGDQ